MTDSVFQANTNRVCIGCGLCANECRMIRDSSGFLKPEDKVLEKNDLADYCPSLQRPRVGNDGPWGPRISSWIGWNENETLRHHASSGGMTTELASFALDSGEADAVLCVSSDSDEPLYGKPRICKTAEEVAECAGSRYVSISPLCLLPKTLNDGLHVVVIGRPCDARAVRAWLRANPEYSNQVPYVLSFFCAGIPSRDAADRLLQSMGGNKERLETFQYRGNGWPGFATARHSDGTVKKLTYDESWGKVLGRDVAQYCRFCPDGVGDAGDIACGDAWYLGEDGAPSFSEADGRNVVFARTSRGAALLERAARAGRVHIEQLDDDNYLERIQNYQFTRRVTLYDRQMALALCGKKFRSCDVASSKKLRHYVNLRTHLRIFLGTVKRIIEKKIDV